MILSRPPPFFQSALAAACNRQAPVAAACLEVGTGQNLVVVEDGWVGQWVGCIGYNDFLP